ncbi:hypothetical protein [Endozoicomonas numazuensis]|nr:hypothetical protein [Endozoicomonas numazuensis]
MKDTITVNEAYKAMILYLEHLYELTSSDELAGFLGSMAILEDGKPADSAVWQDWLEAIEKAKTKQDISLKLQ